MADKTDGLHMSIFALLGRLRSKKPRTGRLRCPSCNSDELAIRQRTGLEFVISGLTDTRKYRCFNCHKEFRAPDRRKTVRAVPHAEGVTLRRPA